MTQDWNRGSGSLAAQIRGAIALGDGVGMPLQTPRVDRVLAVGALARVATVD